VVALHHLRALVLHVVAQVVEAEFVVGRVGDVAVIGGLALFVIDSVHDHADGQAEEIVQLAHPLGVALGQIVVDGHDMDAAAGERVQIDRQRRDQRLALARLHLRDRPSCSTMPPISCTSNGQASLTVAKFQEHLGG
jgi:hypothetical protein